jgi:hypothetical protein
VYHRVGVGGVPWARGCYALDPHSPLSIALLALLTADYRLHRRVYTRNTKRRPKSPVTNWLLGDVSRESLGALGGRSGRVAWEWEWELGGQ